MYRSQGSVFPAFPLGRPPGQCAGLAQQQSAAPGLRRAPEAAGRGDDEGQELPARLLAASRL